MLFAAPIRHRSLIADAKLSAEIAARLVPGPRTIARSFDGLKTASQENVLDPDAESQRAIINSSHAMQHSIQTSRPSTGRRDYSRSPPASKTPSISRAP